MWPLFSCEMCGRRYRYKSHLCRHRRYECGQEPQFPCLLCPYKAKRKEHLQQHLRFRHSWREYHSVYACCALTRLRTKSNYISIFAANTPEDRNHIAHVCCALTRLSAKRICSSIFASDISEENTTSSMSSVPLQGLAHRTYTANFFGSDTLEEKTTTSMYSVPLQAVSSLQTLLKRMMPLYQRLQSPCKTSDKSSYIVYPLQTLLKKITRVRNNFALATLMAKSISISA